MRESTNGTYKIFAKISSPELTGYGYI